MFSRARAHIRYSVKASVDRPERSNYESKKPFIVIEDIDVNNPALVKPMKSENDKFLGCLCCESGPLTITTSIDRAGYCPGESVMVSVSVENLTNREIRGIRLQLLSVTTLSAEGSTCQVPRNVIYEQMMGDRVPAGSTERLASESQIRARQSGTPRLLKGGKADNFYSTSSTIHQVMQNH